MYYILNQMKQMIAVDHGLLSYLNLNSLEVVTKKVILNELKIISPTDTQVEIYTEDKILHFTSHTISMESTFGNLTLIELTPAKSSTSVTQDKEALSTLVLSKTTESTIDEIRLNTNKEPIHSDATFDSTIALYSDTMTINALEISSQIGISVEDYNTFLDEYIDTALSLESDLQSSDTTIQNHAIDKLNHLAEILHLPKVNSLISQLPTQSSKDRIKTIGLFYKLLSRFSSQKDSNEDTIKKIQSFGEIRLEDVEPISFDFHLSQVADNLPLPIALIEEFIHDFIDQTHSEIQNILHAYKEGDLKRIQYIANLLKEASSNLRIGVLPDTLYDIECCEDPIKIAKLIRQYWGQFLSFEQEINTK